MFGWVMKNARALCALAAITAAAPGCFSYHYRNASEVPGEEHEEWASYFLFGIVGNKDLDTREFCGQREVAEITTGTSFLTWLLSSVTLGIYVPRTIQIRCSSGQQATTSFDIDFTPSGEPNRVVRRRAGQVWTSTATPMGEGRYGVNLREVH
jgi:hypothetical protein